MIEPNNQYAEEGLSPTDVVRFTQGNWKIISIGMAVGAVLGFISVVVSPKYQATASIQVAKVAGDDVEAANILVEKLKMPMYYTQDTFAACNVMDSSEPGEAIVKGLRRSLAKNTPIISIAYQEKSTADAKKCLESVLNDIRTSQNILAKPMLEVKRNELNNLKRKLDSAEKVIKVLPPKNRSFDFSDSKFSASTLLLAAMLSKENEVNDLRAKIADLEIALTEPQTKEASLLAPIFAPATPAGPGGGLIALLSGIVGGILTIGYLLGRRVWLKVGPLRKSI